MRALGIDVGTTKIAAVTVDVSTGEIHVCGHAATPTLPATFEGEHIQDARAIIDIARELFDANLSDDVCAIGIS